MTKENKEEETEKKCEVMLELWTGKSETVAKRGRSGSVEKEVGKKHMEREGRLPQCMSELLEYKVERGKGGQEVAWCKSVLCKKEAEKKKDEATGRPVRVPMEGRRSGGLEEKREAKWCQNHWWRLVTPVRRGKTITKRGRGKWRRNLEERERPVEWCTSEQLAYEAEKKRDENPAWWEEIDDGVVAVA